MLKARTLLNRARYTVCFNIIHANTLLAENIFVAAVKRGYPLWRLVAACLPGPPEHGCV